MASSLRGRRNLSKHLRLLRIPVYDEDSFVVTGRVRRLHEETQILRVVGHRRAEQFLAIVESHFDMLSRELERAGGILVGRVSRKILDEKQGLQFSYPNRCSLIARFGTDTLGKQDKMVARRREIAGVALEPAAIEVGYNHLGSVLHGSCLPTRLC